MNDMYVEQFELPVLWAGGGGGGESMVILVAYIHVHQLFMEN